MLAVLGVVDLAFPLLGPGLFLHVDQDRHAQGRPALQRNIGIIDVTAAGRFLPCHHAPHAAVAFGDADVGYLVRHHPVPGGVGGEGRSQRRRKNGPAIHQGAREVSRALQHGSNLCLSRMFRIGGKTPHCVFSVDEAAINRSMYLMLYPNIDVSEMFVDREKQRSSMHSRHLNEQLVRVLKTIGYDVGFQKGQGQYLFDRDGARYLDLLSGFGVFAIGRNHPVLRDALKSVLDSELPNLVQLDVSTLAGILAERLLAHVPYLDKVFFANSGAEAVEGAIKFARTATGRPGLVFCDHAYHGLTNGALSLNGDAVFRDGFGPLLPDCIGIPFNDLVALERAWSSGNIAAFIVEPIQGKGVNMPADGYLQGAAELCHRHGTLFVADEIQTGMGRTGLFLAVEHWNVEPDMVLLSKALSGGHMPVSAVLMRRPIYEKMFDRMDRAVVHGSTFAKNDL